MGNLLKKATSPINFFTSNVPIFSAAGTGTDWSAFGTGYSSSFTETPDGIPARFLESGSGQNVTFDANIKSVVRTGRTMLACYYDWLDDAASTAFNSTPFAMRLDDDGTFADPFMNRSVSLHPGWNTIVTGRKIAPANSGAPFFSEGHTSTATSGAVSSWAGGLTRFRGVISGLTSLKNRLYFAQFVDDVQAESRIIPRFDDAYESVYTIAFPIMQARGIVGVLGVISSLIGTAGYMTWAQVRELYAAGWEIANHTHSHLSNDYNQTEAYWIAEINTCSQAILDNVGVWPTTFISPFGNYIRRSATGYRSAVQLLFDVSLSAVDANLGPCLMQGHYLPCQSMYTHGGVNTAANHIARIKDVVAAGASVILMFHNITAGATATLNDLTIADFTLIMDEVFRQNESSFGKVRTVKGFVDEVGIKPELLAFAA